MRLLLDTHIFLWYILKDARLPLRWHTLLRDPANMVFLSAVSVWEACIKYQLGKLPLPNEPAEFLPLQRAAHQIEAMPVSEDCLRHLRTLPFIHKDPSDRILLCQAIENNCLLVTDDADILKYPAPVLAL